MSIDLCDLAETLACNPSPDNEMFKALVIRALASFLTTGIIVIPGTPAPLTALAPTFGDVNILTSVILPANPDRKGLIITNSSSANVSLAFGHAALLYQGVTLFPGGSFNMGEFDFVTSSVSAIGSDDCQVSIQEFE